MGCFAFTCCLSELPIEDQDDVMYFLLTENPYEDSSMCGKHDMWFPRTYPIRARYNHYASIEGYDEKSPGVFAIVAGLEKDIVETGVGDNSVHDVSTKRGMDFDEILNAVIEQRILVSRQYGEDRYGTEEDKIKEGIPTLQRVSDLLTEAGHKVENSQQGYLVDEKEYGWVRIRSGGYGNGPDLEVLLPPLHEQYAAMITTGSGNYSDHQEIQVMPLPAPPEEHRGFLGEMSKKPVKVYQAMILKEVWDAIIATQDFDKHRKDAQESWDRAVRIFKPRPKLKLTGNPEYDKMFEEVERMLTSYQMYGHSGRSHIPFTMGIAEFFDIAAERHAKDPFTNKQVNDFLDDVAGFTCFSWAIGLLRWWYRPSFSCGPQDGEFKEHVKWQEMILGVAKQLEVKHRYEEDEDWNDEDEEDEKDEKDDEAII